MKTKHRIITILAGAALALSLPIFASASEPKPEAEAGHAHGDAHVDEHEKAGPNGGRIFTSTDPHAEFFVTAERKVQITFLGEGGVVVAPGAQIVTLTAGDRAAPTKLTFAKSGNVLLSDGVLPAGDGFPTVVQIQHGPGEKTVTEKFNLNLAQCPSCSLAEYACTCEH